MKWKWYYCSLPSLGTMELKPNYSVTSEKEDFNKAVDLQSMRDVLHSKSENIFKQIHEIIDSVIKTIKMKIV